MKKFVLFLVFGSLNVFAQTTENKSSTSAAFCSTHVRVPSQSFQGSCNNGLCTAYVFSEWITTGGYCNDGSYFNAETRIPATTLTGQCVNGRLWMRTDSQYYHWYGRCSNGGYFYAPSTYVFGNDIYGSCVKNGTFWGSTQTDFISLQAQCSR